MKMHCAFCGETQELEAAPTSGEHRKAAIAHTYACKAHPLHALLAFLKRAAAGEGRVVSSGDLLRVQIVEAQATDRFYVDESSSLGWALVPWELTTEKDEARQAARAAASV